MMRILWLFLALLIAIAPSARAQINPPTGGVVTPADTTPDFPGTPISGVATPDDTTPDFPGSPISGVVIDLSADVTAPSSVVMTLPDLYNDGSADYDNGTVAWTATCEDNVACSECQLQADGTPVGTADTDDTDGWGGTWDTQLTSGNDTQYTLTVRCEDVAENFTVSSSQVVTVDVTAPTTPGSFAAAADGSSGIDLAWTNSTDASSGVAHYQIERCTPGTSCTPSAYDTDADGTPYADTGLTAETLYRYDIYAVDGVGNQGVRSGIAEATTGSGGSTVAYYVSKSGDSGNACQTSDGTEDATKARLTITAGMQCLSSGDTLIVKAGVYDENLTLNVPNGTSGNHTTIQGVDSSSVIIRPTSHDATPQARVVQLGTGNKAFITFKNFVIDMKSQPGGAVSRRGIELGTSSSTLSHDLLFEDVEVDGASGDAIRLRDTYGSTFRRMHIHNIAQSEGDTTPAGGIYWQDNPVGTAGNILEDSIIEDNLDTRAGSGIGMIASYGAIVRRNIFYNIATGGCISIRDSVEGPTTNLLFINNICGKAFAGLIWNQNDDSNTEVYNNTIFNTTSGQWGSCFREGANDLTTAQAAVVKNNICWGLANTDHQVPGNLYTDPSFVDEVGTDFSDLNLRLQSGSTACDTALDLSAEGFSDDIEGTTRPVGDAWDYGAYERACP